MTKPAFCPNARGTTYDKRSHVFRPRTCKMRSCPYCRVTRAYRILLQLREEGTFQYSLIDNFNAYRKKLERKSLPYIGFPLPEGHIVISTTGESILSDDPVSQIEDWIARSIPGKNISTSREFGGEYSGCRPEPDRERYVHSEKGIGTILADLKVLLRSKRKAEDTAIKKAEKSEQVNSVPLDVVSENDVVMVMD